MIYGILTNDPEYGEDCVLYLRDRLTWAIAEAWKYQIDSFRIVSCNKWKTVRDVRSDKHLYYPDCVPFLWDWKQFKEVRRKTVIKILKKRSWTLNDKYYNYDSKSSK